MNISLTPELEHYVQDKVATGFYTSVSEVIREALRLMYTQDTTQEQQLLKLNYAIDIGLEQLKKGQKIAADEAYKKLKEKIKK